jgi:hypothetical protein
MEEVEMTDGTPESVTINIERLTDVVRGRLGRGDDDTIAVLALTTSGVKIYAAEKAEVSVTDVPLTERDRVLCVRTFLIFVDKNDQVQACVPPFYFKPGPAGPEH